MIKQIFKTVAVLSLVAFAGQASADTIDGQLGINVGDASADFSWTINANGHLEISFVNNSGYLGLVTAFQFNLGDDAVVTGLTDVDGSGGDGSWGYDSDAYGCYLENCVFSGSHFWNGGRNGIAAGSTATFRFVGDFTNLSTINDVLVRFRRTGEDRRGRALGWGCDYGCEASEVPEPGTLLMFAAGLLGFGFVARRRRII